MLAWKNYNTGLEEGDSPTTKSMTPGYIGNKRKIEPNQPSSPAYLLHIPGNLKS